MIIGVAGAINVDMLYLVKDAVEPVLAVVAFKDLKGVLQTKILMFDVCNELRETGVLQHLDLALPLKLAAVQLVEIQHAELRLRFVEKQRIVGRAV